MRFSLSAAFVDEDFDDEDDEDGEAPPMTEVGRSPVNEHVHTSPNVDHAKDSKGASGLLTADRSFCEAPAQPLVPAMTPDDDFDDESDECPPSPTDGGMLTGTEHPAPAAAADENDIATRNSLQATTAQDRDNASRDQIPKECIVTMPAISTPAASTGNSQPPALLSVSRRRCGMVFLGGTANPRGYAASSASRT